MTGGLGSGDFFTAGFGSGVFLGEGGLGFGATIFYGIGFFMTGMTGFGLGGGDA